MQTNHQEVITSHQTDLYLYFYEDFIDESRTSYEGEFILEETGLEPGDKVLDLACGHGRHSIFLAQRGMRVTGIDLHEGFIALAQQAAVSQSLEVEFMVGDMAGIEYNRQFNGIVLLYNSFGFLDKDQGNQLIGRIAQALKPKGRLILDIRNGALFPHDLSQCQVTEKGNDLMIDRLSYDLPSRTVTNDRIYIKDGVRYDTPFTMQLYTLPEVKQLIANHNLAIEKVYGQWDKSPFNPDSKRIIALIGQSE